MTITNTWNIVALNSKPTAGTGNIAIGYNAGNTLLAGCNNIIIGPCSTTITTTSCNTITIGNLTMTTCQRAACSTWTALSDCRDKTNIKDMSIGLDFISEVRPVTFTWNTRDGNKVNVPDGGFVAQELLATSNKYGVNDWLRLVLTDNPDNYYADPGKLLPVAIKAIQDLKEEVVDLRNRVTALEDIINKSK